MKTGFDCKVVHSESKSAWNVINSNLGGKYKIARVPYITSDDDNITTNNRLEALIHAKFICDRFNDYNKDILQ